MVHLRETLKSTIFLDNLNDVLDGVSRRFRLIVLGDLNGWIGDQKRDGITGGFGVAGENENGRKVIDFCEERGMCVILSLNTRVSISILELV